MEDSVLELAADAMRLSKASLREAADALSTDGRAALETAVDENGASVVHLVCMNPAVSVDLIQAA